VSINDGEQITITHCQKKFTHRKGKNENYLEKCWRHFDIPYLFLSPRSLERKDKKVVNELMYD
jgi:hypothetical protein